MDVELSGEGHGGVAFPTEHDDVQALRNASGVIWDGWPSPWDPPVMKE